MYDDDFVRREAAKRKLFNLMFLVVFANIITLCVLFATGYIRSSPVIANGIIILEIAIVLVLFLKLKKTMGDSPRK